MCWDFTVLLQTVFYNKTLVQLALSFDVIALTFASPWQTCILKLVSWCFPRREAGDVWCLPPVWTLKAVIWFHFAIPSLALLPSPVTLSVLSFSAYWSFLLNFFQKILQYFSLRGRLLCMAPVSRLGDDNWSVVCATCCHMTLVFAVMHLYNNLEFFYCFCPFLFHTFFKIWYW